jgi:hypothetical protein
MWSKSFSGVCPTISSIRNMLGFMWNVVFACGIGRVVSRSSISTLLLVCVFDCSMPLLLLSLWDSSSVLRSYLISTNSFCRLSLQCAVWSKSSARQSWTIRAIISPSSSVIIRSCDTHCAFDFLCMPAAYLASLLFPTGSCAMGFGAVSYIPLDFFGCSLVSFCPFWVPVCFDPSLARVGFFWTVLGFLGTGFYGGCVSACVASPSASPSGTSWGMDGIFHSASHSLMTMSISPSVMQ